MTPSKQQKGGGISPGCSSTTFMVRTIVPIRLPHQPWGIPGGYIITPSLVYTVSCRQASTLPTSVGGKTQRNPLCCCKLGITKFKYRGGAAAGDI